MDEKAGTLRVNDARLITKDRRAFCRRLVHAVARRPGVSKTMIDLASASCRVEFAPGTTDLHAMAGVFADSVREASAAALDGDGTPWWQPSTNWVALTAYPFRGRCFALGDTRGQPRPHPGPPSRTVRRLRAALTSRPALSRLDTVESCKAIPWSHRLTIDFRPENGVADWFLDQAERSFEDVLASETHQAKPTTLLAESPGGGGLIQVATGPAPAPLSRAGRRCVRHDRGWVDRAGNTDRSFLAVVELWFRSLSPRMNRWLRETRFLGPILTEWEQHGGLSRTSKNKLIGLTVIIILIAVVLAPLSPLGLVLILVMASLSIYGLYRLPSIPEEPRTDVPCRSDRRGSAP